MINLNKGISAPIAISIIIVLAVILTGGVLSYRYWWASEDKTEAPQVESKDKISDWKTYRNEIYKYEIKCPYKWETKENSEGDVEFIIQGVATININFISQDTLNVMGISYCGAYPEDKNRCEKIVINDLIYIIEKFSDSKGNQESVLIGNPRGGALSISLISATDELRTIFRKVLSTFRFID